MEKVENRFFRYVKIDTQSDPDSETTPSTKKQFDLANLLVDELRQIGISDAILDEYGYVYGTLKSNINKPTKTVGFIAHMDTAPDLTGKNVNPQIVDYKGGDIKLNDEYSIKVEDFPFLKDLVGEKLITTDGTTLLGSDDKAGITIILSAIQYLSEHPEIKHGDIKIAFTPDEEIGRGSDKFNVEYFNADFAYTIDGGELGELSFENFNAAEFKLKIKGKVIHPGSAKNIMINSALIAMEFNDMLPAQKRPEYTSGYEGFYMLDSIKGSTEETEIQYIIREFNKENFEKMKEFVEKCVELLKFKYNTGIILEMHDEYYNMYEKIKEHMYIINLAENSMKEINITPKIQPIRGGTDGASLSYKGLLCPNIFAGGYNFHGRYEFIPISSLEKGWELLVKIAENLTK